MLHNTAPNGGMLLGKVHQLRGKGGGQLRTVSLHKIIQTVTDADSLHFLMRADITSGSVVNFPLFHLNNLTQRLQIPAAVAPYRQAVIGMPVRPASVHPCIASSWIYWPDRPQRLSVASVWSRMFLLMAGRAYAPARLTVVAGERITPSMD